jgi:hypothetical protein
MGYMASKEGYNRGLIEALSWNFTGVLRKTTNNLGVVGTARAQVHSHTNVLATFVIYQEILPSKFATNYQTPYAIQCHVHPL